MGFFQDALNRVKKAFGSKGTGESTQPCPLKETGLLVVVVRDDNHAAVTGAGVDIKGKTPFKKQSDNQGIALFKPVEPDTYSVTATLPSSIKDDFSPPDATQATVPLGECPIHIVHVQPLAALKVRVVYRDPNSSDPSAETYLDGVTVHVEGDPNSGKSLADQRTGAGATGWATYQRLKAGQYKISVASLGSHASKYLPPAEATVDLLPGKTQEVTLVAVRSTLSVKVVEDAANGKPIKGIKIKARETGKNAALADKTSSDSAPSVYEPLGPGNYEVSLVLTDEDKKKYKLSGDPVRTVALGAADQKEVVFILCPMVRVHLKLQFKDPEDAKRPLPEKFPVRLVSEVGDPIEAFVGKDGLLYDKAGEGAKPGIDVERRRKTLTLEFPTDKPAFIVCEKRGEETKTQEYIPETDPYKSGTPLAARIARGARALRTPKGKWTLKNSDWEVLAGGSAPPCYNKNKAAFIDLDKPDTTIGDESKPVELTLDPHWQFLKFEYFDRFYGHSVCKDKPISVLPLFIEGYAKPQDDKEVPVADDLTTQCNWTIGPNDKELVQCVPWIIRRDDKDAELKHPTKDCTLRFITDEDHRFIKSNKMSREFCRLDDTHPDKHHLPCADRLRYYDLPAEWRSTHYYCRLSDKPEDQDFYEILVEKETKKDKPLIFSLDDMVLTDETLKPVDWRYANPEPAGTPNDRVAIFSHKFSGPAWTDGQSSPTLLSAAPRAGGVPPKPQPRTDRSKPGLSPDGLYLHEGKGDRHDYSAVCVPSNYIADYPDWTRLIIAQGNVHDVFDKRTTYKTNAGKSKVVGARAAVRWVESAKPAHAALNTVNPRPSLVKHPSSASEPFFATQPLFEQRYQWWYERLGSGNTLGIGRFDPILLRCCDVESQDDKSGQTELAASMMFMRVSFDFQAEPDAGKTRAQYMDLHNKNVCDRWNGREPGLSKPTTFVPVDAAKKLKVRAFYFAQSHPRSRAHLEYKILANNDPNARQWCGSSNGTGMLKNDDYQATGAHIAPDSFTAAHEFGHFGSQPDDYGERWTWCSGWQLDFINYVPGLPYDDDQRAMMRKNHTVRARNLWFAAEWCRVASDVPFKVKFGNDDLYHIPRHPQAPARNYTSWPVKHLYDQTVGGRSKFDLYLYLLGEDATSKNVYNVGGTADGVLVVAVKLEWNFNIVPASWAIHAVSLIDQHIRSKCNGKFYATGKVTVDGEEKTLNRCLIIFQPRYLLTQCTEDPPSPATPAAMAKYNNAVAQYNTKVAQVRAMNGGPHFNITVDFASPPPAPAWGGPAPDRNLAYAIDGNNTEARLRGVFYRHFREMIGLPNGNTEPDANGLKPIAALILTNSDVRKA